MPFAGRDRQAALPELDLAVGHSARCLAYPLVQIQKLRTVSGFARWNRRSRIVRTANLNARLSGSSLGAMSSPWRPCRRLRGIRR
jgi:hypothetical protein